MVNISINIDDNNNVNVNNSNATKVNKTTQKHDDKDVYTAFHLAMAQKKGFMYYYFVLDRFIGRKVYTKHRVYKINLIDVYCLNYFISLFKYIQKTPSNEYMMEFLNVKRGTFLEALKKWRALGILEEKTVNGVKIRLYVNVDEICKQLNIEK